MRNLRLILFLVILILPAQLQAENWPTHIDTSHPLWAEIQSYLPDSAHDVYAMHYMGSDGREYIAIQYSYVTESYDTEGLLIGEAGGQWNDFRYGLGSGQLADNQIAALTFFDKLEFATFSLDGKEFDFLFAKGAWAAAGGSARGPFFEVYKLNTYDYMGHYTGPTEEFWDSPSPYGVRDCDFRIYPESNSIVVWIESPFTYTTMGYRPYPIKQYMYTYYEELGLNLIRMDTTTELYSTLPPNPPFQWL